MRGGTHRCLPRIAPQRVDSLLVSGNNSALKTQLSRFIGVGVISAIVDYGLLLLLMYFGMGRNLAKAISWCAGTLTAYFLNAKYTFNQKTSAKSTAAVAALYLSTFAVQNVLFWLLKGPLEAIGLEGTLMNTVAFVIAQGVATVTNFIVQRMFIFNDKGSSAAIVEEGEPLR